MADIAEARRLYKTIEEAFIRQDVEAVVSCYAEDYQLMANGFPLMKGHDALRQMFNPQNFAGMTYTNNGVEFMQLADDIVISNGSGVVHFKNGDRKTIKDFFLYRKIDGKWKVFRDTSSYDTA